MVNFVYMHIYFEKYDISVPMLSQEYTYRGNLFPKVNRTLLMREDIVYKPRCLRRLKDVLSQGTT